MRDYARSVDLAISTYAWMGISFCIGDRNKELTWVNESVKIGVLREGGGGWGGGVEGGRDWRLNLFSDIDISVILITLLSMSNSLIYFTKLCLLL